MKSRNVMNRLITPLFVLLISVAGCSAKSSTAPEAESEAASQQQTAPETAKVTLVDEPSLVCMVNNQFMGKPQIPVEVDGTTYYGCCEMCKTKLADDPASRTAIDPVSGATVDKARAVMGKTSTGAIHYFESKENLAKFAQG
jgi:YHS domain-containing protein